MASIETVMDKTAAAINAVQIMLREIEQLPQCDRRSLAVVRTQMETAFLWAANATHGEVIFNG